MHSHSHFALTDLINRLCTKEEITAEGKRTVAKYEKEFENARKSQKTAANRNGMRHIFSIMRTI